jgi:hypothetical protein
MIYKHSATERQGVLLAQGSQIRAPDSEAYNRFEWLTLRFHGG